MKVDTWETVQVRDPEVTADLIIWKRYRRDAQGILEVFMDANPNIARAHKYGPFLPVGMTVRVPIVYGVLKGDPAFGVGIELYPS